MKFLASDCDYLGRMINERIHAQAAKLIRAGQWTGLAHVSLEDFETLIAILNHGSVPGFRVEERGAGMPGHAVWVRMLTCGRELEVWPADDLVRDEVRWAERAEEAS